MCFSAEGERPSVHFREIRDLKHERVSTVKPRMPKNTGTHQGLKSCHETLSFVLNVRPSRPSIATQYACISLPEENGQDFQEFLDAMSRPPSNLGSTTECVSMNTLLVKFHTLFLPELSEGPLMADGHHVLEEVASRRREMLGSVLSVRSHAGLVDLSHDGMATPEACLPSNLGKPSRSHCQSVRGPERSPCS